MRVNEKKIGTLRRRRTTTRRRRRAAGPVRYAGSRAKFHVGERVLWNSGRMCRTSEPYSSGELVATGYVEAVQLWRAGTPSERLTYRVRFDKLLFPGSAISPTPRLDVEAKAITSTTRSNVRSWTKIKREPRRSAQRKPAPKKKGTTE